MTSRNATTLILLALMAIASTGCGGSKTVVVQPPAAATNTATSTDATTVTSDELISIEDTLVTSEEDVQVANNAEDMMELTPFDRFGPGRPGGWFPGGPRPGTIIIRIQPGAFGPNPGLNPGAQFARQNAWNRFLRRRRMLRRFDADGDGKLNEEELAKARAFRDSVRNDAEIQTARQEVQTARQACWEAFQKRDKAAFDTARQNLRVALKKHRDLVRARLVAAIGTGTETEAAADDLADAEVGTEEETTEVTSVDSTAGTSDTIDV